MLQTEQFTDEVKIFPGGQITIPNEVQAALGVSTGSRITFVVNGNDVRIENAAVYAMKELRKAMAGEAERAGLYTEDDVAALVKEVRRELSRQQA